MGGVEQEYRVGFPDTRKYLVAHALELSSALVPVMLACSNVPQDDPKTPEAVAPTPIPVPPAPQSEPEPKPKEPEQYQLDMHDPKMLKVTGGKYRVEVVDPEARAERNEAMSRYRALSTWRYSSDDTQQPWIPPREDETTVRYIMGGFTNPHVSQAIRDAAETISTYSGLTLVEGTGGVYIGETMEESFIINGYLGTGSPNIVKFLTLHLGSGEIPRSSERFGTIQHELLHMLGAGHFYTEDTEKGIYGTVPDSVMHYSNTQLGTPGIADISYLQAIYGPNMEYKNDDTHYKFDSLPGYRQVLWDAGGLDIVDLTSITDRFANVDLREGNTHWSIVNNNTGQFQFAYGSNIENAAVNFGSIDGNSLDNVLRTRAGYLEGHDGDDVLHAHSPRGDLHLDGGKGKDVFAISMEPGKPAKVHVEISDFNPKEDSLVITGKSQIKGAYLRPSTSNDYPRTLRVMVAHDTTKRTIELDFKMSAGKPEHLAAKEAVVLASEVSRALVMIAEMPDPAHAGKTPAGWQEYIASQRSTTHEAGRKR